MEDVQKVVFARELRVHEQDLDRLKYDYAIQPIEIMGEEQNGDSTHYVLPAKVSQIYTYYHKEIETKQAIIDKIPGEHILQYIDNNYIEQNIGKGLHQTKCRNPARCIFHKPLADHRKSDATRTVAPRRYCI